MNFSNQRDLNYKSGKHLSVWPWSDVISLVSRYKHTLRTNAKVLEIGCGAGANIEFFKQLNIEYFGLDGSNSIISSLKLSFPELQENLIACDFTKTLYFDGPFDLIIDRASLTHNDDSAIRRTIKNLRPLLTKNGKFISVDWFSNKHCGFTSGESGPDKFTRCNFTKGSLAGTGNAHFSDRDNLLEIFEDWKIIYLMHKICDEQIPIKKYNPAFWNLAAEIT